MRYGFWLMMVTMVTPAYAYDIVQAIAEKGYFVEADCENEPSLPLDVCGCESNVAYPTIKGLGNSELEADINRKLAAVVERSGCAEEGESMRPKERTVAENEEELRTTKVKNTYEVTFQGTQQVSFLMTHSFYGAGAAHEMTMQKGITVNLADGDVASNHDVLDPKHAKSINDYIRAELKKRNQEAKAQQDTKDADTYWLVDDEGRPKDYMTDEGCSGCQVYRDKEGWKLSFALYSVAPFSLGHVVVPLRDSFIKPEWGRVQ